MRNRQAVLCLALAAWSAACAKKSQLPANSGSVRIYSSASAFDTATGSTAICAHFSLQPYIPSSSGTPTPSGGPVTFTSTASNDNDASAFTDQVLGCIDGTPDAAGDNWGYIVTATDFTDCASGNPLTNVSPQTVTFNVAFDCKAGLDVSVPMHAQVAVSDANQAGYVDISAGVNATEVQIGCKQADISSTDGLLHFGESFISSDGSIAQGLVGLDTGDPSQFGGDIHGASASQVDTYYTGDINPAAVHTVYQTFLNPCADGTSEYADTNHAQCVSNNSGQAAGTVAELADVFAEVPGQGFAAVSVVSGGLTIYSSVGSNPNIMNAAATPFTPSYNVITTSNLNAPAGYVINGVFIDQSTALQFLVSAIDNNTTPATPVYATLSHGASGWTLSSFSTPTATAISCNGLYAAPSTCFVPSGPCGSVCEPQTGTVRGWTDGTGAPASVSVGSASGAPSGATWQCTVSRAASSDTSSTFKCSCSNPPAGWTCSIESANDCVLAGPCDGASGTTPVLVIPKIPDTSLPSSIANTADGTYVYTATEMAGGSAVGATTGSIYLHSTLDNVCACKAESSLQEVVDFINHQTNGVYDNVPDCSTTAQSPGACISHDPTLVFGANTRLSNPNIALEFASTDNSGHPISVISTVLNWVVGTPLYRHGYGIASYPPNSGLPTNVLPSSISYTCTANQSIQSLRRVFTPYPANGSSVQYVVATREYGQLESKPTGSCANVFRTGIKQDPLIWPPTTGPNGKPQLHNAPHIPEGNPTATAAVDGNGVLGDIDCTSGAVTDAHGDGICLRKVSGKLQIQRYWHNFMCTFQLNDDGRQQHMSKAAFSQKTADPGSVSGNGLDGTLYLPE